MLTKGFKTSEFYLILAALGFFAAQHFGYAIDLEAIFAFLSNAQNSGGDIAGQVETMGGPKGTAPYWLAFAYMVGRQALKLAEIVKGE